MGDLQWGLIMMGALLLLCVVIVVIASFHVVWLIRLLYSVVTKKPMPAPPFSKSRTERFIDS